MANTHSTLTDLFTDIADAIREKTGGTETIIADNFPEAIDSILTPTDNTIPTQPANIITPGTSNQIAVASGVYTTGAITVAGDSDLVAANIISGKNIFGVIGTAPIVITSTTEVTEGSASSYPAGSLYVVYEE